MMSVEVDNSSSIGVKEYTPAQAIALVTRWAGHDVDMDELRHFLKGLRIPVQETQKDGSHLIYTSGVPRKYQKTPFMNFILKVEATGANSGIFTSVALECINAPQPGYYELANLPKYVKNSPIFWQTMKIIRPLIDEAIEMQVNTPITRFLGKQAMVDVLNGINYQLKGFSNGRFIVHQLIQLVDDDTELVFKAIVEIKGMSPTEQESGQFISFLQGILGDNFQIFYHGKRTLNTP